MRPILLDLFCGAGGASAGYAAAGFDVLGVDVAPQPNYPYPFIQGDALQLAQMLGRAVQAIHASPPCQPYSPHVSSASSRWAGTAGRDEPALIGPTRELLEQLGRPYVIENVMGARHQLHPNLMLCGVMFGLPIPRHRLFELRGFTAVQPFHQPCRGVAARFADEHGWDRRDMTVTGKGRRAGTADRWRELLGWPEGLPVTQHGLREAIPPAYTEHIGQQLMALL